MITMNNNNDINTNNKNKKPFLYNPSDKKMEL